MRVFLSSVCPIARAVDAVCLSSIAAHHCSSRCPVIGVRALPLHLSLSVWSLAHAPHPCSHTAPMCTLLHRTTCTRWGSGRGRETTSLWPNCSSGSSTTLRTTLTTTRYALYDSYMRPHMYAYPHTYARETL